jgi:hypothetical protein
MSSSMFVVEGNGTIRDAAGKVVVTADPNGSMRAREGAA